MRLVDPDDILDLFIGMFGMPDLTADEPDIILPDTVNLNISKFMNEVYKLAKDIDE